jgi:hypothetical protein
LAALGCVRPPFSNSTTAAVVPTHAEKPQLTEPGEGASDGLIATQGDAQPAPQASAGGAKLLTPDDFTFVGSYPFTAEGQATFGMGLTCRRVNDQLRFLTFSYRGKVKARLIEFALPDKVGQKITTLTASWDDIWSPAPAPNIGGGDEYGLWWEDQGSGKGRLWTTHCTDYPSKEGLNNTQALAVRGLNTDGTVTKVLGEYGLQGVGQRAIYGGIQPVPQWFRDKFQVSQPYAVGWGGYTSLMAQGLVPSMGLIAVAIPDVTTYKANSVIPAADFKILADHRSGTTARDWYSDRTPARFDRGQRNADVVNYFDRGDKRENPSTPPPGPPAAGAQWLSPAPDGFGRFVWGDTYFNTGCWIDGPTKGGLIVIGTFAKDKAYYGSSTLHNEGRHAELQIFDPNDFGAVLQGKKRPWNVQPAATKLLTKELAPLGLLFAHGGNNASGGVVGATFDPATKLLYLWCPGVNGKYDSCLVVYQVNC